MDRSATPPSGTIWCDSMGIHWRHKRSVIVHDLAWEKVKQWALMTGICMFVIVACLAFAGLGLLMG